MVAGASLDYETRLANINKCKTIQEELGATFEGANVAHIKSLIQEVSRLRENMTTIVDIFKETVIQRNKEDEIEKQNIKKDIDEIMDKVDHMIEGKVTEVVEQAWQDTVGGINKDIETLAATVQKLERDMKAIACGDNEDPWSKGRHATPQRTAETHLGSQMDDKPEIPTRQNIMYKKPILESKSVSTIEPLSQTKGYLEWFDTFANRMEQARPGYGDLMRWLRKTHTQEITPRRFQDEIAPHLPSDATWQGVNSDIWAAMLDKTKGNFRTKFNQAGAQEIGKIPKGLEAMRILHKWIMDISGRTLAARKSKAMAPPMALTESDIINAIESWEQECKDIAELDEAGDFLSDSAKVNALKNIVTGDVRKYVRFHCRELKKYEELREAICNCAIEYEIDSKEAANADTSAPLHQMSQDDLDEQDGWYYDEHLGAWIEDDDEDDEDQDEMNYDLATVGKGKGKGKAGKGEKAGGKSKGKGKGGAKGSSKGKGAGKPGKGNFNFPGKAAPEWKFSNQWGWYLSRPMRLYQWAPWAGDATQNGKECFNCGKTGHIKANCWQPGGGAAAAPRGGDDYQQSNKRARTDQGVDIDALKRVLAGHSGAKGFGKGSKGDIYKVSWEEPAPAPKQPMVLQDMYCCKVRNAFDEIAPGNEEEVHEEKNETNIWNQDFFRIEKHAICNSLSYTAAAKELHRKNSMHEWNVAIGRKKPSRKSTTKRSAARRRRQDSEEDASPKVKPSLQCIECNLSASLDSDSCSAPKPASEAESVIGTVDHISTDFVDSLDASALNILHDQSKWELVKVTIDSGACDHVMPKEIGKRFEIFPTKESLAGRNFSAANNTAIKNYGAREISGVTDDWTPMVDLKFNVADVKRCLASTTKLKKDGFLLVLDDEMGEFMVHKATGRRINFMNDGGTPTMNLWIRKPDPEGAMLTQDAQGVQEDDDQDTGFLGLGFD